MELSASVWSSVVDWIQEDAFSGVKIWMILAAAVFLITVGVAISVCVCIRRRRKAALMEDIRQSANVSRSVTPRQSGKLVSGQTPKSPRLSARSISPSEAKRPRTGSDEPQKQDVGNGVLEIRIDKKEKARREKEQREKDKKEERERKKEKKSSKDLETRAHKLKHDVNKEKEIELSESRKEKEKDRVKESNVKSSPSLPPPLPAAENPSGSSWPTVSQSSPFLKPQPTIPRLKLPPSGENPGPLASSSSPPDSAKSAEADDAQSRSQAAPDDERQLQKEKEVVPKQKERKVENIGKEQGANPHYLEDKSVAVRLQMNQLQMQIQQLSAQLERMQSGRSPSGQPVVQDAVLIDAVQKQQMRLQSQFAQIQQQLAALSAPPRAATSPPSVIPTVDPLLFNLPPPPPLDQRPLSIQAQPVSPASSPLSAPHTTSTLSPASIYVPPSTRPSVASGVVVTPDRYSVEDLNAVAITISPSPQYHKTMVKPSPLAEQAEEAMLTEQERAPESADMAALDSELREAEEKYLTLKKAKAILDARKSTTSTNVSRAASVVSSPAHATHTPTSSRTLREVRAAAGTAMSPTSSTSVLQTVSSVSSSTHELDLSDQPRDTALASLAQYPRLRMLSMSNCQLTEVPPLPATLEFLDISYNDISDLGESLKSAPRLRALYLDHNHVSSLVGVSANQELTELRASANHIADTTGLEHLLALETLVLKHNEINNVASIISLAINPKLASLDLQDNPIMGRAVTVHSTIQRFLPQLKVFNGRPVDHQDEASARIRASSVSRPKSRARTPSSSPGSGRIFSTLKSSPKREGRSRSAFQRQDTYDGSPSPSRIGSARHKTLR